MKIHVITKGANAECFVDRHMRSVAACAIHATHAIVLDPCNDDTFSRIAGQVDGDRTRIVVNKSAQWCMANTRRAIELAQPAQDDIIAVLDLDDMFYDETVLQRVMMEYRQHRECALTYGSFVRESTGRTCSVSDAYDDKLPVRRQPWHGSHLKTFRYWLWQRIPPAYMRDERGNWLQYADDRAYMTAMIELAGWDRVRHIGEPLVIYNDQNYLSSWYDPEQRPIVDACVRRVTSMPPLERVK